MIRAYIVGRWKFLGEVMAVHPHNFDNEAADLVGQMTLQEKTGLMSGRGFWTLKSVERLGLKQIMVSDGPHGLRKQAAKADHVGLNKSVPATCFPTAVALAASWDRGLLQKVGDTIGLEAQVQDLAVVLGPGINMKRHPHCGRNFEYFSEDPLLAGELAAAYINGVQARGVGTSLKHFAANNQEHERLVIDTVVDERTLREIYLPAFEIAVKKAQPWTIMCAYNKINGTYCSEHDWLLTSVLRDEWDFQGLVVTDWGAANERPKGVGAGLDLEMPGSGGINDRKVAAAVEGGGLAVGDLDLAAKRVTSLIMAGQAGSQAVEKFDADDHHAIARAAAAQSAVLLKNDGALLPLAPEGDIAVIGSFAKQPRFQGAGSSQVNPTRVDQPLEAIEAAVGDQGTVRFAQGYDLKSSGEDQALIDEAVAAAKDADTTILFVGLPSIFEMEGADRSHMGLPEQHNKLVTAVSAVTDRLVVVLSNGSPVALPWVDDAPAILEVYLAGQAGAGATADLLFGKANPSGRLAETFPLAQADVPSDPYFPGVPRQVTYREGLYIGYRYFDSFEKPVLFPFGHGLSYTDFAWSDARLCADAVKAGDPVTAYVTVTNTGDRAGAEVVQLYVRDTDCSTYRPRQELKGFDKVWLNPGESRQVAITLDARAFAFWDTQRSDWVVEPGQFDIMLGASSRDERAVLSVTVENSDFENHAYHIPQTPAAMTDQDFAALGTQVAKPVPIRPYHRNSTMGDLRYSFIGRQLLNFVSKKVGGIFSSTGGKDKDETQAAMLQALAMSMPLRVLLAMGRGAISERQLDGMIDMLNHRYIGGLRKLLTK